MTKRVPCDWVYVQNPFNHLRRDADIEGQTDGFSEKWSHGSFGGITDKSMAGGWLVVRVDPRLTHELERRRTVSIELRGVN